MENALIIGASGGIGAALADALSARGAKVVRLSRSADGFDLADAGDVRARLRALEGGFDLVICATGILASAGRTPEKTIRDLDPAEMARLFAANCTGPAMVLREAAHLLPRKGRSVMAVLSARVGSIGDNRLGGWYSYRASKAALNQVLRGAAIEVARTHPKAALVALHPGTVATSFTRDYQGRHPAVPPAQAAANLLSVLDGLSARDTGRFFDWQGSEVPW